MKKESSQKIERVLWVTDFSEESQACLPWLKFLSEDKKTVNMVLHVVPAEEAWQDDLVPAIQQQIVAEMEKVKKKAEVKLEKISRLSGIELNISVIKGRLPSEEILKFARGKNIDLILIGKKGQSKPGSFIIGTTTLRLARTTKLPMLVVPYSQKPFQLKKLLVPVDLKKYSLALMEYTFPLIRRQNAIVHVLHVYNTRKLNLSFLKTRTLKEDILRNMTALIRPLNYDNLQIHAEVGDPTEKILEYSEELNTDLTILTTHQKGDILRTFLGSVAEKILIYSNSPVLILPPYFNEK